MSLALAGCGGRACKNCRRIFTPSSARQVFCRVQCRWRFNYRRTYYPRHVRRAEAWLVKRCKGCNVPFHVETRGRGKLRREYCTERCAKNARNRRHYARTRARAIIDA